MANTTVIGPPTLMDKMRALAEKLPDDVGADLCDKADKLEKAIGISNAHMTDGNDELVGDAVARQLLGAWARARKLYCLHSGEPLI